MAASSFYERAAPDTYRASTATESPWGRHLQHGGPPCALLVAAVEREHPRPDMRVARAAIDFLGPIPRAEVVVRTRVVRPGKKIELAESAMLADGREVAVARVWRIAPLADARLARSPAPPPTALPAESTREYAAAFGDWGYGDALEWRFTQGGMLENGPAGVWTRLRIPLDEGDAPLPLDGLLVLADSANGISGEVSPLAFAYVPPGIAIALRRYPEGEWTHLAAATVLEPDGIGTTRFTLADAAGEVGYGEQPLLVRAHGT